MEFACKKQICEWLAARLCGHRMCIISAPIERWMSIYLPFADQLTQRQVCFDFGKRSASPGNIWSRRINHMYRVLAMLYINGTRLWWLDIIQQIWLTPLPMSIWMDLRWSQTDSDAPMLHDICNNIHNSMPNACKTSKVLSHLARCYTKMEKSVERL